MIPSESSLPNLKHKRLFVVLRDSSRNETHISAAQASMRGGAEVVGVSGRWVEECVKRAQYIEHDLEHCFTFRPFGFETPLRELMAMKVELVGIDEVLKRRYR
jgi:hypothetical protein